MNFEPPPPGVCLIRKNGSRNTAFFSVFQSSSGCRVNANIWTIIDIKFVRTYDHEQTYDLSWSHKHNAQKSYKRPRKTIKLRMETERYIHTLTHKNMNLPNSILMYWTNFWQPNVYVQQKIFWKKPLIEVGRSHLYASFGTFCVQIGSLF